jgi:hypothetical protein
MRAKLINQDTINYYKRKAERAERIDIIPITLCIIGLCIWMLYYRYLSKGNKRKEIKII